MHFCFWDSPVGRLLLAADDQGLRVLRFADGRTDSDLPPDWQAGEEPLAPVIAQLQGYFAGHRTTFELDLAPQGSPFQQDVWRGLRQIPFGRTLSYGALAQGLGKPKAVRALGSACGANPIAIIIPCHRVIGGDGSLTGYAGGLARKAALLNLEGLAFGEQLRLA